MSTQVFEKNGNRYTYSINNISTNAAVPDETFVFDAKKYPGVKLLIFSRRIKVTTFLK
jgi:outer membrane lipoprotein-sorting protein